MASSTAVWYAVSTGERQGAAAGVSMGSLNVPQPVAYTKEGVVSASDHCAAQDSCTSYFELLMHLLPLPRHSSSSVGCCTGHNTRQSDSPSQPPTMADNVEPSWTYSDTGLTYVARYTNSSSIQQSLPLGTPQSSNMESVWDHSDTDLTYVPTYSNGSSTLQNRSLGTPQSRRPAAMICPPAPVRLRPTMILVPAEELHMCACIE